MEVILREDVPHLGATGDIVKVKPGFARNFLLPRGLALVADRRSIHVLEHQKRLTAQKREKDRTVANSFAERLRAAKLAFKVRTGEDGKLFGSVTNLDIERALGEKGLVVERRRIRLEEPIKSIGEFTVIVHLAAGVNAEVSIVVESEQPVAG